VIAAASALAAQDAEPRPWMAIPKEAPLYSIDVECVATGTGHNDRYVGRIAMVNEKEECVFDVVVDPIKEGVHVESYLEPLTGLNKGLCDAGVSLSTAISQLKSALPTTAVLVGQGIEHDIAWCKLAAGADFHSFVNIADIFKTRLPHKLNSADCSVRPGQSPRYRFFSLRHTCQQLLSIDMQAADHNPIADAAYSMRLFHRYRNMEGYGLRAVRDSIARTVPTPSFAETTPVIEGVAMGRAAYKSKWNARFVWAWWCKWRKNARHARAV